MKKNRVVQLGCGMQGKACLYDLLNSSNIDEIIVADNQKSNIDEIFKLNNSRVKGKLIDANNFNQIEETIKDADVVIELLPGIFAFKIAQIASKVGVNLVSTMYLLNPGEQDINKREEQKKKLSEIDSIMKNKGKTILEEFGMDPGIDLVLGKKALDEFDEVKVFHSYGAGFPEKNAANNPIHYKFTWSIVGVMRSYLRPATIIKEGKPIKIPADEMFASANTHILNIPELGGNLECFFNGDSSYYAEKFNIKNSVEYMGRYICRWPGHGAFWYNMAKCGFLSEKKIKVENKEIVPAEFCASIFQNNEDFFYKQGERDVAFIRIDVRGYKNKKPKKSIYQIIDYRDLNTGFTAMQRTVGFPASIGAQMILDGRISLKGVVSPYHVNFDEYIKELEKRNIYLKKFEEDWNGINEP